MSKHRRHIAVIVRQGTIQLLALTAGEGHTFSIADRGEVEWQDSSLPPSEASLQEVLKRLAGGKSGNCTASISIHPSFVLCRSIDVPPANRKEVAEYIQLWCRRQWPDGNGGSMRVAWRKTEGNKALVAVTKARNIQVFEKTLSELRISISWCGLETSAMARLLPEPDCWIACGEEDGVHLARSEGSRIDAQAWYPSFSGNGTASPSVLREIEGRSLPVCLYGSGISNMVQDVRKPGWWSDKARKLAPAIEERPDEVAAIALGSAEIADHSDSDAFSFVAARSDLSVWQERIETIAAGNRGRALVGILAICMVILLVGGGFTRSRLYAGAEEAAEKVALDEDAARTNIQILYELSRERRDMLEVLDGLREARPDPIRIEHFSLDAKGSVSLSGMTNSYATVEQFTAALNESRFFRDAVTQSTSPVGDKAVKYSIRCRLGRTR